MSDPQKLAYDNLVLELECGQHLELACYCNIHEKVDRIRSQLGEYYFQRLIKRLCMKCNFAPPPQNKPPRQPPLLPPEIEEPPVKEPPVVQPPPVRQHVCPQPAAEEVTGRQV